MADSFNAHPPIDPTEELMEPLINALDAVRLPVLETINLLLIERPYVPKYILFIVLKFPVCKLF
jgi:hypothetical protein